MLKRHYTQEIRQETLRQQHFQKRLLFMWFFKKHIKTLWSERQKKSTRWTIPLQLAVKKTVTPHASDNLEASNILNSMHSTKNYYSKDLSLESDLLNHNQLDENPNCNMNEALLPTDFGMDAVIPLEREKLMYLPSKFENDVRRKALIDTRTCANATPSIFYLKKTGKSIAEFLLRVEASFISKCPSRIREQFDGPWSNWRSIQTFCGEISRHSPKISFNEHCRLGKPILLQKQFWN